MYILRVCLIDVFYSLTTCRFILDKDFEDYLEYEGYKSALGLASDFLDFLTAILILRLFHHYLKKQYSQAHEERRTVSLVPSAVDPVSPDSSVSKISNINIRDTSVMKSKTPLMTSSLIGNAGLQIMSSQKQSVLLPGSGETGECSSNNSQRQQSMGLPV